MLQKRRKKKVRGYYYIFITFVSLICNNVLKHKNSLSGKDAVLGRLVCNTGKQKINLVIQSLNYEDSVGAFPT